MFNHFLINSLISSFRMWLLCALTTFLCGDSLKLSDSNADLLPPKEQPEIPTDIVEELVDSSLLDLFEYNFTNDSIFDISQRMDLFQVSRLYTVKTYFCDLGAN